MRHWWPRRGQRHSPLPLPEHPLQLQTAKGFVSEALRIHGFDEKPGFLYWRDSSELRDHNVFREDYDRYFRGGNWRSCETDLGVTIVFLQIRNQWNWH